MERRLKRTAARRSEPGQPDGHGHDDDSDANRLRQGHGDGFRLEPVAQGEHFRHAAGHAAEERGRGVEPGEPDLDQRADPAEQHGDDRGDRHPVKLTEDDGRDLRREAETDGGADDDLADLAGPVGTAGAKSRKVDSGDEEERTEQHGIGVLNTENTSPPATAAPSAAEWKTIGRT